MCVCVYIYIYIYICVCVCACIYISVYMHIFSWMGVSLKRLCVYIYICVCTYIQRDLLRKTSKYISTTMFLWLFQFSFIVFYLLHMCFTSLEKILEK